MSNSSTPSPNISQTAKKAKNEESKSSQPSKPTKNVVTCENFDMQSVMAEITEQLKTTLSEHVNVSVTAMAQSVANIITESINDRMTSIEHENSRLNEQIHLLNKRVEELESYKQSSIVSIDTAEQYSRRSCLRISGIKQTPDESTDDIVLNIARACDAKITLTDIDRSHRIPPRSPSARASQHADIIVKFVSYRSRAALFSGKSRLKKNDVYSNVYINEDLTRYRAFLLRSARKLVKDGKINSAWSYDGRIFIKNNDGSRHLINSEIDFESLR